MVALMSPKIADKLPLGEMDWHDPRSRYRTALITEGAMMVDKMGLPVKFVSRQLGLSREELDFLDRELEIQKAEQEAQAEKELQAQMEMAEQKNSQPPPPSNRP
jgi:hypothetical protein